MTKQLPFPSKNLNRATIHDVARIAGVSKSTVSRVLNGRGYTSLETIEKVQKAIDELNFVPQASARGLVSQRTRTLGLAVNDLTTLFIPQLLSGIEASVRDGGYNLLIAAVGHQTQGGEDLPLGPHNTDGIIAFADSFSDRQIAKFRDQNFPMVFMHKTPINGIQYPSINIENEGSTRELVHHLINAHNRKKIVFLHGPEFQQDSIERENGYRQALDENDIEFDPSLVTMGGFSTLLAEKAISKLIESGIQFDAVFGGDDEAAVGVIRELRKRGYRVPEDIAVVGFDDDFRAADVDPPLTTIHVPFEDIGWEAGKSLLNLIEKGEVNSKVLNTNVVIRKSCGC